MSGERYTGLRALAFTVGVALLIFLILYTARRYNPRLFGRGPHPLHSWYHNNPNDPQGAGPDRENTEKPKTWDVYATSWYPLCPRHVVRSERLGSGKDEDNKRGSNSAVNAGNRPKWQGSFVLSADKVSDAVPPPRAKRRHPIQYTPTQLRISAVILMPTPPRPTSRPSTSSSTPSSSKAGGNVSGYINPQRGYVLGTSYIPYTPDC